MPHADRIDGPRPARAEERDACIALADRVFRLDADMQPSMGREFPTLFAEDNVENLYVIGVDGELVALFGVYEQVTVIDDVEIPVACVGAVCTHADHRGRGYAGRLMDLAVERTRAAGNRLMYISGRQRIYLARGASRIHSIVRASLPSDRAVPVSADGVRHYVPVDLPAVTRLHDRQPLRFRWDPEPTAAHMNAHLSLGCGAWVYAPGGSIDGFLLVRHQQPLFWGVPGHGDVVECYGEPDAVAAMASAACRELKIDALDFPMWHSETGRRKMVEPLDATWSTELSRWTVKVLDLAGLVADLIRNDNMVQLTANGNALTIATPSESVTLREADDGNATLFGEAEHWPAAVRRLDEADQTALRKRLPIPLCSYGINYI